MVTGDDKIKMRKGLRKMPAIIRKLLDVAEKEIVDSVSRAWDSSESEGEGRKVQNVAIRIAIRDKDGDPSFKCTLSRGEKRQWANGEYTEDGLEDLPGLNKDEEEIDIEAGVVTLPDSADEEDDEDEDDDEQEATGTTGSRQPALRNV